MFEKYIPSNVIHLAARVGGIIDNMNHPAEFIYRNVQMSTYIICYANKYKIKKILIDLIYLFSQKNKKNI